MNNYDYPLGADTMDAPWNRVDYDEEFGDEALFILTDNINSFSDDFTDYLVGEHFDCFDWDSYNELTHEVYLMLPKSKRDELELAYKNDLFECEIETLART